MTSSPLRGRPFYCREWALQRLQHCLEGLGGARAPGILITGAPGAGKTALCAEILWPSSEIGYSTGLGVRVLAYHFCRAHAHASLCPHQFIAGLAQQLRDSPLISGYNERVQEPDPSGDVDDKFKRLVLLPLISVPPPSQNLLLLVDSVDEMCCCCRSDGFAAESSCSIAELLASHHHLLPPWLLLVCTVRRQNKAATRMFTGFRRLCLDDLRKAHVVRDVQQYILRRLDREENLRKHLTLDTAEMLNQLHIKSNGCFLYLERVLDGVSDGSVVLREIRHMPGTLNGLYLWLCQRLFPGRHFCQVQTMLNALLASPQPLAPSRLYEAVRTKQMKGWSPEDFGRNLASLSGLLLPSDGPDSPLVLFHHSFSEWLLDVKYCTQKYLCNVAEGHSMLAMGLSTRAPNLTPKEVHQLARHLLLSDLPGLEPSHLALWLLWTEVPISDCLVSNIHLELEVLQLLLLARGAPDGPCDVVDSGALRRTLGRGGSVEMLLASGAGVHQRDRSGRTLLAAAAQAGNLEAVKLMISRGANLEAADEEGQTALGLAAHQGHLSVVQLLLQHSARHDRTDSRGWTPLRSAAWGGHTEVVQALLASRAHPDVSGPDGRTALRAAAWGGHEGPVKALLAAGARADQADAEGRTPLMAAAYMGHRSVAELFLDAGADINWRDSEGRTALSVACLCVPAGQDYPELVSLLLEHGADPELEDKDGVTPLLVAAYEGQAEVAELLLEAGADPDREGKCRMTPLLAAASGGYSETVRVLLLWGATADATDAEGRSALAMAAAALGGEEAVRVLLDRGLDENHRDQLGWTPLHWAACQGRRSTCRTLIEGGAKVGIRDHEGYTPLLLAAQEGHTGCVELLLNRGSPVDQRANDGRTALCSAALVGHRAMAELLLRRGADPNVKNMQGKPLLYLLVLGGQIGMTELLLEQGADPEGRDPEERTALHACCWLGDWDMAHLLLVKGEAQPNASDMEKRTPLHCAAWKGHTSIARLLLENGAFSDAQTSQGATPLCIAAQEGHKELGKVLLEEGKSSPHHADHYGRNPMQVAAKGGHVAIMNLLERYGVPPYQGPLGTPRNKSVTEKKTVEGSGSSWSTLSPVSTGSHSMDNSLKSSQGSVLTSSTYHSQATVPMDSLTFTQQVQQHSLPRSRSRQTLALIDITGFQNHYESTTQPISHQNPSSPQELDKWEQSTACNQYPKRGSPVTSGSSRSRSQERSHILLKTNSSGYSSGTSGNTDHKGTGNTKTTGDRTTENHGKPVNVKDPANFPQKVREPLRSTTKGMCVAPPTGNTRDPVYSPGKARGPQHIPTNTQETVHYPTRSGLPVNSSTRSGLPVNSPTRSGLPVNSPTKSGLPVNSPTRSGLPVNSPTRSGLPVNSPTKSGLPVNSPTRSGLPVNSPTRSGLPVNSPTRSGLPVNSPTSSGLPVNSPTRSGLPEWAPCELSHQA
ncbi:ankyrin repeat domain-containing protein 50-like [Spea bombifrons]|uniref:ankyrin repeat domain-containing protein 50-like n=1 Tax=Spea bombifrons TaxID=233779 RepID=UPI002349E3CD|nr:ankyrin repeat domain-containing protein 50-like [Spea bombifrons]